MALRKVALIGSRHANRSAQFSTLLLRLETPYLSRSQPRNAIKAFSTLQLSTRLERRLDTQLRSPPLVARSQKLIPRTQACSVSLSSLQPRQRGRIFRFFYHAFAYTGGFLLISGGLVLAFFAYDATTYREDLSYTDVPVSVRALEPRRGGPKNLPIAEALVDDDDSAEMSSQKHKPKLVILGSGWGSVALLKTLNPEDYHITVVSPVNYFLFTPMLPSATVGTLELRSLVEPMRGIVQRVRGHFLKAEAVEVELSERLLEVSQTDASGEKRHFYLPYDKLVIGVGQSFHNAYQTCC